MFLERPGEVVTRDAVRERLWPADTFVDFDHSLNTAINKLRQALGDSAENPRFIETLAVAWLRTAADGGFPCYPWFATDPLLAPIREYADYTRLMTTLRERFEAARARYSSTSQSGPWRARAAPGSIPLILDCSRASVLCSRRMES
jgi:hypothetical protein